MPATAPQDHTHLQHADQALRDLLVSFKEQLQALLLSASGANPGCELGSEIGFLAFAMLYARRLLHLLPGSLASGASNKGVSA